MKYSKKEKLNNLDKKGANNFEEAKDTSFLTVEDEKYIEKLVKDAYTNHKWLMDELSK